MEFPVIEFGCMDHTVMIFTKKKKKSLSVLLKRYDHSKITCILFLKKDQNVQHYDSHSKGNFKNQIFLKPRYLQNLKMNNFGIKFYNQNL